MYERLHTREMAQMSGLGRVMPIWGFFMVFFTLASVGLPGLNGFVSEFLSLLGAFLADGVLGHKFAIIAAVGMIFGAIYLLYMLGRVVWGPLKLPDDLHGHDTHGHAAVSDLNGREVLVLTPIAIACLVLGLFPTWPLQTLKGPIARLTRPTQEVLAGPAAAQERPEHLLQIDMTSPRQMMEDRAREAEATR
jgi:NADH-quinone oxidoreductase subunit M